MLVIVFGSRWLTRTLDQPPPTTYWDLFLVLGNKDSQICLDILKHIEERYNSDNTPEPARIKANKLAYVLYRWVKSKLSSSDDQWTHVNSRITQLAQQIVQHHATRAVNTFLIKNRAPTPRETLSLTRLRSAMDTSQRAPIDQVLKATTHVTAQQCPFCEAVIENDHCTRNPAHPLQFCALTMMMIDTPHTLKCTTCHHEALILRDDKENNFDWVGEVDLCPTCNSLLTNSLSI